MAPSPNAPRAEEGPTMVDITREVEQGGADMVSCSLRGASERSCGNESRRKGGNSSVKKKEFEEFVDLVSIFCVIPAPKVGAVGC